MFSAADLPGREFGKYRLYAFRFADGRLKIGITSNVRGRAKTLEYEHRRNGVCPEVEAAWFSPWHLNAHANEVALHAALAEHRLSGEYFSATDEQLRDAVAKLSYQYQATPEQIENGKRVGAALNRAKYVPSAFAEVPDTRPFNDRLVDEARLIFGDLAAEQLKAKLAA